MVFQAVATCCVAAGCSNTCTDGVGLQRFATDPVLREVMDRIGSTPRSQDWELRMAQELGLEASIAEFRS